MAPIPRTFRHPVQRLQRTGLNGQDWSKVVPSAANILAGFSFDLESKEIRRVNTVSTKPWLVWRSLVTRKAKT